LRVFSRRLPTSLRARLVGAILIVAVAVMAASFFALHQVTGADLRGQIDDQLQADLGEFQQSPAGHSQTEPELLRRARAFVAGQGYHADSRIFAIGIGASGRPLVTNERDAIAAELAEQETTGDGDDAAGALLGAPPGLATIAGPDQGGLRVLTEPIHGAGGQIGTFRVAQSLAPVGNAEDSLRNTLLVVGALAMIVLVAAALWIGSVLSRPLRRIAGFAAEVDTAGLGRRLTEREGPAEVRSLAHSFNHMLDRLQRAFAREREFVADASHELRTPVTIAQGELELLRRELGEADRDRVDVVRRELKRMERLISEMLALASEESDAPLRHEPVSVADLLADLRRDLPLMGPREYRVAAVDGTIEADPDRLAQVFRNLLQNAVAHTQPGGAVRVDAEPQGSSIRFEVHDDGPGFGPEEATRLFDRFYRSPAGRPRDANGSGLGLAIARSIVEAHGGRIWAEATGQAGGATVAFELPGYRPEDSATAGS
jgi:two-component system, OmpR family, sensor kinase